MFNIGFGEFILLGIIALVVLGPKQLPEVARVVGRLLGELKRTTDELTGGFVSARNRANDYLMKQANEMSKPAETKKEPVVENKPPAENPDQKS